MSHLKIEDLNVERTLEETELTDIVGGGRRRRRSYGHGNSYGNAYSPWGRSRSRYNHYPTYSHGGYNGGHYGGYNGGRRRGHGSYYGNRHGGFQMNLGHGFGFGAYGNH